MKTGRNNRWSKRTLRHPLALCCVVLLAMLLLAGCGGGQAAQEGGLGNGWQVEKSMDVQFANQFAVDYYQDGYKLLTTADDTRVLIIPEGKECPEGIDEDIISLQQPVENIYLAASSAMCLFDAVDGLDAIRVSSKKQEDWYIENAAAAMAEGKILYGGKYSEPDYEMLLENQCPIAIESLMIGHASEVGDKLEELGIPVLVDLSSMESHPLGRTEWIKVYAAMLNKEAEAQAVFDEQVEYMNQATVTEKGDKTVAFFHIGSSGQVAVRRTDDYITKMLDMAGGNYVFDELMDPEKQTSTINMEMEQFFATARDADYIIYNTAIMGELGSMEELIAINPLLAEFKAVQEGNVWCTERIVYQEITKLGEMLRSFRMILSGEADDMTELPYLYRLQ